MLWGFVAGIIGGVGDIDGMKDEGNHLWVEDIICAEKGAALERKRMQAGTQHLAAVITEPFTGLLSLLSVAACPGGALAGYAFASLFDINRQSEMMVAGAKFGSFSPFLMISGLFTFLGCELGARDNQWTVGSTASMLLAPIWTGKVDLYFSVPSLRLMGQFNIPWLNKSAIEMKPYFEEGKTRTWLTYAKPGRSKEVLPFSMISRRTSSIIYLNKVGILELRKGMSVSILGSGRGGIAQGLLASGLKDSRMKCYTLPEQGWVTLPTVFEHGKSNNVDVTEHLVDIRETTLMASDLIVCDTDFQSDDPRIPASGFTILRDFWDNQQRDWRIACKSVRIGGTVLISLHGHPFCRLLSCVSELSIWFEKIKIVYEPLFDEIPRAWIIGTGKRRIRFIPSLFTMPDSYIMSNSAIHETGYYATVKNLNDHFNEARMNKSLCTSWLSYLHKTFRTPVRSVGTQIVLKRSSQPWKNYGFLHPRTIEWYKSAPVEYENSLLDKIGEMTSVNLPQSKGGFTILGSSIRNPVPDREFNTGVNTIIARTFFHAGCEEEVMQFVVPHQSNFAMVLGLYKRYDFVINESVSDELVGVFEDLRSYLTGIAKDFDFHPLNQEELLNSTNVKSTLGYMTDFKGIKMKDMILDHYDEILKISEILVTGGKLNLGYHASPKVEKKEDKNVAIVEPRLFQYKVGEMRLAEMRLTQRMNFFLGASHKFICSASGTIFERSERIGQFWDKLKNPACIGCESMKWDGHMSHFLSGLTRELMVAIALAGKNGSEFATMAHSTSYYDVSGLCWMANGLVVEFLKGCTKSGCWDTSVKNKLVNFMILLSCIRRVWPTMTLKTIFTKFLILIEGDDGLLVGEYDEVLLVLQVRDKVYAECGFPQDETLKPVTDPTDITFCSHGIVKELSTGRWLPIRPIENILGRLLVPLSNGAFELNVVNSAKTLSTVISSMATFFHLKPVRDLWYIIRRVIPKSVLPASVNPQERWKLAYNLGDFDFLRFDADKFASEVLGVEIRCKDLYVNISVMEKFNFRSFAGLGNNDVAVNVLSDLKLNIGTHENIEPNRVWYSKSWTWVEIENDFKWCLDFGVKELVTEEAEQLRDLLRFSSISTVMHCRWMSLRSFLSTSKARTYLAIHTEDADYARLTLDKSKNEMKYLGYRGTQLNVFYKKPEVIETSNEIVYGGLALAAIGCLVGASFLLGKRVYEFIDNLRGLTLLSNNKISDTLPPRRKEEIVHLSLKHDIEIEEDEVDSSFDHTLFCCDMILGKPKFSHCVVRGKYDPPGYVRTFYSNADLEPENWVKKGDIWRVNKRDSISKLTKHEPIEAVLTNCIKGSNGQLIVNTSDYPDNRSHVVNWYGGHLTGPSNLDMTEALKGESKREDIIHNNEILFRGKFKGGLNGVRSKFVSLYQFKQGFDVGFTNLRRLEFDTGFSILPFRPNFSNREWVPKESWRRYEFIVSLPGHSGCGFCLSLLNLGTIPIFVTDNVRESFVLKQIREFLPELVCEIDEFDETLLCLKKMNREHILLRLWRSYNKIRSSCLVWYPDLFERFKDECKPEYIEESMNWKWKLVGHKSVMRDLKNDSIVHGMILDINSPGVKFNMLSGDHGCGYTCGFINIDKEIYERVRNVPTGSNCWDEIPEIVIEEIRDIVSKIEMDEQKRELFVFFLRNEIGTLGSGNHFVELSNFNSGKTLTIHCGSRNFKNEVLKLLSIDPTSEVDGRLDLLKACEEFAMLNRRVIFSYVSGEPLLQVLARNLLEQNHSELIGTGSEFLPERSFGVTKNLCHIRHNKSLLLGNPESGSALLTTDERIVPHGTGPSPNLKGKHVPLLGISKNRLLSPIHTLHRQRNAGGVGLLKV